MSELAKIDPGSRWYYTAEYPDQVATYQMNVVREKLIATSGEIVADIVKPQPR